MQNDGRTIGIRGTAKRASLTPAALAPAATPGAAEAPIPEALQALPAGALRRACDPSSLPFMSTAEAPDIDRVVGQSRAIEAIDFAVSIRQKGYNLFILGPGGLGKHSAVRSIVEQRARQEPTPADICFVHDFARPQRPRLLRLPAGRGKALRADMQRLLGELFTLIPATLDSEGFRGGLAAIERDFEEREGSAFRALGEAASKDRLALVQTPQGFMMLPAKADGAPMDESAFAALPEDERKRLSETIERYTERLQALLLQGPRLRRERAARVRGFGRETVATAVAAPFAELVERYRDLEGVELHLAAVREDVLDNFSDFVHDQPDRSKLLVGAAGGELALHRYQVNLLVDRSDTVGAPVVVEDNPTLPNLSGRVEHLSQMGMLVTNFTLIRAGALHRANGGYLLLDVHRLLSQPFSWEALKRALNAGEIRIESVPHELGLSATVSLEPEPVPLEVKVVLFGARRFYYLLSQLDPDFRELFKVAGDFDEEMPRTAGNEADYAALIATLARRYGLRPLDREAVARLVDHAARLAGDATRLSLHVRNVIDLAREADLHAATSGRPVIAAADVGWAVEARHRRADRASKEWQEAILRNAIMIDTEGEQVGEVNGLAAVQLGEHAFARPVRITATARVGDGDLIDIEREVELGGPIHSKGVLILASFLAARFATNVPLSLSASLVFEQTYAEVEGDSASLAELCALLSVLADLPIRQSLAITGSVNQLGQVQAIGAVNEKIEGFFDLCKARGLTGRQGVVIPASNRDNLMLRDEVVEAARAGLFHVYTVHTVDEAIEILTGVPAGLPDERGMIGEGTVNYAVARRLLEFSMLKREYTAQGNRAGSPERRHHADDTPAEPAKDPTR